MTQNEVADWLHYLCYSDGDTGWIRCSNDEQRVKVICNLLHHASEDRMSSDDRTICVSTLGRLTQSTGCYHGLCYCSCMMPLTL